MRDDNIEKPADETQGTATSLVDIKAAPDEPDDDNKNAEAAAHEESPIGCFARYLTLWVALSMGLGLILSRFAPAVAYGLNKATIAQVSIPVAVFIWLMVFPMMLQIDIAALKKIRYNVKPLLVTSGINYLIQPFSMYAISLLFFRVVYRSVISPELANQYIAGAVILGGSPCTAMVFVWSALVKGNAMYTLTQVALNDALIFVFYIPTVMLLLRVTHITIPWSTAFLSVALFMCAPALFGIVAREYGRRTQGDKLEAWIRKLMIFFEPISMIALLLTIVAIFTVQGAAIIESPAAVFMIALPLTIQTYFMFVVACTIFYKLQTVFEIAAPGCMIATSNFFELAVAVAMALFGTNSAATLVTTVGVLVEVPIMLSLVWLAKRFKHWFPSEKDEMKTNDATEDDPQKQLAEEDTADAENQIQVEDQI